MKKSFKYLVVVVFMFLLVGCGAKDNVKDVTFEAKYIRTDGSISEVTEPVVKKITSLKELNDYYTENKENYNFTDNSELSSSFTTEIDKYDEEYFKNSFLLVVLVQEEGSDIYHTVKSVKEDGKIVIERNLANHEASDVATWHVLIELSNSIKDVDYKITMKDVK